MKQILISQDLDFSRPWFLEIKVQIKRPYDKSLEEDLEEEFIEQDRWLKKSANLFFTKYIKYKKYLVSQFDKLEQRWHIVTIVGVDRCVTLANPSRYYMVVYDRNLGFGIGIGAKISFSETETFIFQIVFKKFQIFLMFSHFLVRYKFLKTWNWTQT